MSTKSTWGVVWVVGLTSWALAACGSKTEVPAASPAAYPGAAPGQPATPAVESAPAQGPPGYGQPGYAQPPPDGATPAPEPALAQRRLETVEDASSALDADELRLDQLLSQPVPSAQAGIHACQRVCAALGSMARSVDAVCELAGQDDHRCARARQRLETNTRRVAGAGCTC